MKKGNTSMENRPGDKIPQAASTPSKTETSATLRTHMANERTFLAWCRTSISLIVFGFVVEKFNLIFTEVVFLNPKAEAKIPDTHDLYYVSIFSFAVAGVIILMSGYQFLRVRKMIHRGKIFMSIFPEVLIITSMIVIVAMVFMLMLK
jgi:putative membrane protein